jgi:peptide/nickel transport system ATP-binding protein
VRAPALEVQHLTVDFRLRSGGKLRAVEDASFAVRPGETLALVGESGSGKSTTVRALGRLTKPTAGEVFLGGKVSTRRPSDVRDYRRHVQLVFQDPFASLNPAHTVAHHLARPLLLHHRATRHDVGKKVEELLEAVNLVPSREIARRYPHELSGGQRQRVAIARALAPSPAVLLADEPVSMLDVSIRLEILALLDDLKNQRDLAMLYVTHDLATARHFSSQIIVMYRGEIVERGPSDDVIINPLHPYTQLLAASAPMPGATREELAAARRRRKQEKANRVVGQPAGSVDIGCKFRARCPHAMAICATRPPDASPEPGRAARCWLYADTGVASGETEAAQ